MSSWVDVAGWIVFLVVEMGAGTALMIWPDAVVSVHMTLDRLRRRSDREVNDRTTARLAVGSAMALGLVLGLTGLLFHISRLP